MDSSYKKYLMRQMGLKEAQFIPAALLEKDEDPGGGPLESPPLSPTARPTPVIGLAIRGSSTGGLPSGADQVGRDISPTKVGGYDRVQPKNLNHHTFDKTPSNPEIKQEIEPVNQNPSTGQGVTHPHQIQVTAHEEPQVATGASTDSDPTLKLKSAVPKGIDIDIAEAGNEEEEETKNEDNNTAMIPSTSLSETFERHKRLMREKIGLTEGKCPCGCEGTCQCQPGCKCKKNRNGICECATCGCGDPTNKHGLKEGEICSACNGSGEGPTDGTKCQTCGGSGDSDHHWGKKSRERDPDDERDRQRDKKFEIDEDKKPRVCFHCKQPHPCKCDKQDQEDMELQRKNPEEYRKRFGMNVKYRDDLDYREPRLEETVECEECHNKFNYRLVAEVAMGAVKCPACDAVLDQNGTVLAEGRHKPGCQCGFCKNMGSFGKKKKEVEEGEDEDNQKDNPEFKEKDEKQWRKDRAESDAGKEVRKQQKLDESYAAPFQKMRSLAGIGNTVLMSNGLFENKNDPGANKPFNTHWKMDKEKAGFVKIDEEKLKKVKASLERKSKRGTLSDKELQLAKRLNEVLKKRGMLKEDDTEGKCAECGKALPSNYNSDTCPECKAKLRPDRLSGFIENK